MKSEILETVFVRWIKNLDGAVIPISTNSRRAMEGMKRDTNRPRPDGIIMRETRQEAEMDNPLKN